MANISRWTLFWKAFFASLIFGASANAADQREIDDWNTAVDANTAASYYLYLSLHPAGEFVDDAVSALAQLGPAPLRGIETPITPSINVTREGENEGRVY